MALLSPRRQPKALTTHKILVMGPIAGQGANCGRGQDKVRGPIAGQGRMCVLGLDPGLAGYSHNT